MTHNVTATTSSVPKTHVLLTTKDKKLWPCYWEARRWIITSVVEVFCVIFHFFGLFLVVCVVKSTPSEQMGGI